MKLTFTSVTSHLAARSTFSISSDSRISSWKNHWSLRQRNTYTCCQPSQGWPRTSSITSSSSSGSASGPGAGLASTAPGTSIVFPRAAAFEDSGCGGTSDYCRSTWSVVVGATPPPSAVLVLGALVPYSAGSLPTSSGTVVRPSACWSPAGSPVAPSSVVGL